jgi:hypothetical protein
MKAKKVNAPKLLPWSVFIFLFLVLFICIRFINLPESFNFGSDQGRDFLSAWSVYTNKHLALIGPPSQYAVDGRQFFFGPAPYYVILPALVIGKWSPLYVSYYLVIYNAIILTSALYIFKKCIKDTRTIYIFAALIIFSPAIVTYTRSYWNPYFMFSTATVLLSLLLYSRKNQNNTLFIISTIGFLFGLGLQFHYSFIFAIILSSIFLLWNKNINFLSFFTLLAGFIVGFSPLIAFDITHNFYNLRTFFLIFTSHSGSQLHLDLTTSYYFISVLPFFYLAIAYLIVQKKLLTRKLFSFFFGLYVIFSLAIIGQKPTYLLSYQRLFIITKALEAQHPTDFNIVYQLTTDNRAMPLRYMLTVDGYIPHPVEEYRTPNKLFIFAKKPVNELLKNPVYEINSFLPFKSIEGQQIDQEVYLYILRK